MSSLEETQAGLETLDEFGPVTLPIRLRAMVDAGETIGRYVILAKLGAGGMGVVYAAYDPELDRKVALKLLRRDSDAPAMRSAGRARLLREAQLLARFSHPEIVAVHDVGEHETGIFVAMEFVEGQTLGAWAKQPRSWQEVLAVMRPAGRGVAAAHAFGLVHRDLKPDNIMISPNGRVRVMDFGLTRAHDELNSLNPVDDRAELSSARGVSGTQALLGTPAYMAPEQFSGEEVTAASDQFSYCVTMWELLYGDRPFRGSTIAEIIASVLDGRVQAPPKRDVPIWLRKICERGLARDPSRRWPSMQALLDALEQGEAKVRTRKIAIGLALLGGLALAVVGFRQHQHNRAIEACELAGADIDTSWNDAAREQVRQSLIATGLDYAAATVDTILPYLDAQAQAWHDGRTSACMHAEVERDWDLETSERALWCLDERRLAFDSAITELSRADAEVARTAITLVTELELTGPCVDERMLINLPDPPSLDSRAEVEQVRIEYARAGTLAAAGKVADGLAVIRPARERAEQLGWPPLLAATRWREGVLLVQAADYPAAEAITSDAYVAAAEAGAWEIAADAAIDLTDIVGDRETRFAEGRTWALHARIAIHHAKDPLRIREAKLATTLGHVELTAGRYDEAEALYQRAYDIWLELLGENHPSLGVHLNNLGNLYRARMDRERAKEVYERALALRESVLGPDHPDLAGNLHNLGLIVDELGDHARARKLFERALAIWERSLGLEHLNAAVTLVSLGNLAYGTGDLAQAQQDYARALAIMEKVVGPEHLNVAALLNNLANVANDQGEHEQARQLHLRALAIREKQAGPDHLSVSTSLFNLAMIDITMDHLQEAKPLLERALVITEATYGADHPETAWTLAEIGNIDVELGQAETALPTLERAVAIFDAHEGNQMGEATARFALARALVATGGDRARAKQQAELARDGFRELEHAGASELVKVERWLAQLD